MSEVPLNLRLHGSNADPLGLKTFIMSTCWLRGTKQSTLEYEPCLIKTARLNQTETEPEGRTRVCKSAMSTPRAKSRCFSPRAAASISAAAPSPDLAGFCGSARRSSDTDLLISSRSFVGRVFQGFPLHGPLSVAACGPACWDSRSMRDGAAELRPELGFEGASFSSPPSEFSSRRRARSPIPTRPRPWGVASPRRCCGFAPGLQAPLPSPASGSGAHLR